MRNLQCNNWVAAPRPFRKENMPPAYSPSQIPLRFADDAGFAAFRAALIAASYTEESICARLGLSKLVQFEIDPAKRPARTLPDRPDALDLLIWLLLECESVAKEKFEGDLCDTLTAFGILSDIPSHPGLIVATVMLYPMRGVYIVADRQGPVQESPSAPPADIVYPALIPNTDLFLELVQPGACDSFLDLCAGTGIAALLAASNNARHAYAYDITERSTVFADFNRRLNGLENVTASRGDLYEPAGKLTFDRIVAHPPYVPVYRPQFIFDSGGQDGEQIVRRIIEGLPRHLRPGGVFQSLTMGTDREQPFEQRVREWLGPAEKEFDVAFVVRKTLEPHEWAADNVIRNKAPVTDIINWRAFFKEIGAKAMAYGFITIQRREKVRAVFTVRRQTGPRTGTAEHAQLVRWETTMVSQGSGAVLSARPNPSPGVKLRIEHSLETNAESSDWTPENYLLSIDYPFNMELRAQPWTAYLLTCANGSLTGAELLEKLKTDGALHPDTPSGEFAEMIAQLISAGFLQI